jgi:addiction module HigA family antidote
MRSRSSIITDGDRVAMSEPKLAPIHPGEILLEEFLAPLGVTQYRLAKSISVPPRRINEIVHGKRSITADTGLRLKPKPYETSHPGRPAEPRDPLRPCR